MQRVVVISLLSKKKKSTRPTCVGVLQPLTQYSVSASMFPQSECTVGFNLKKASTEIRICWLDRYKYSS